MPLSTEPVEFGLEHLLKTYEVKHWDLILIGDGSGSSPMLPCGWATTIIDRITGLRRLLTGGTNLGSVSVAELLPYLLALDHFDTAMRGPIHRMDTSVPFGLDVHVFTDSQHTAEAGAGRHSRATHCGLWAGIERYEQKGYRMQWHWFNDGRDNPYALHKLMDQISSDSRECMKYIDQNVGLYETLP